MRPSRDETWLAVAAEIAKRSTCLRRAVGCVLLDDLGQVLATGYNGRARGLPHCNEDTYVSCFPLDACEAVHAEQNALLQCHDVRAIRTCYVTASPCVTCVKLLMQTGCARIAFAERYTHDTAAKELWHNHRGFTLKASTDTWQLIEKRHA